MSGALRSLRSGGLRWIPRFDVARYDRRAECENRQEVNELDDRTQPQFAPPVRPVAEFVGGIVGREVCPTKDLEERLASNPCDWDVPQRRFSEEEVSGERIRARGPADAARQGGRDAADREASTRPIGRPSAG